MMAKYIEMTNARMNMIKKNFPSEEAEEQINFSLKNKDNNNLRL